MYLHKTHENNTYYSWYFILSIIFIQIIKKLVHTFPVMLNNTVISLVTVKRSVEGVTKNKDSRRVKKLVVDITTDTRVCSM